MGMQTMYREYTKWFQRFFGVIIIISMIFSNYFLYYRYVYDNFNKNYKNTYIIDIKNSIIKMESSYNKERGSPDIYLYVMPVINESNLISNNQILLKIDPRRAIDISGVKLNVSIITRDNSTPNNIKLLKFYNKKLSYEPIIKVYKINALLKIKISQCKPLKIRIHTYAEGFQNKAFIKLALNSTRLINNTVNLNIYLIIFNRDQLIIFSSILTLMSIIIIIRYTISQKYIDEGYTYLAESYKIITLIIITIMFTILRTMNSQLSNYLFIFIGGITIYILLLIMFTELLVHWYHISKNLYNAIIGINLVVAIIIFIAVVYGYICCHNYFDEMAQSRMLLVGVGIPHLCSILYNLLNIKYY